MPGRIEGEVVAGKKRKRKIDGDLAGEGKDDELGFIAQLEADIHASHRNYNKILTIISFATDDNAQPRAVRAAVSSLCRIFCRLFAEGRLSRAQSATQNDLLVRDWLKIRYATFVELLVSQLKSTREETRVLALNLSMQAVRAEVIEAKTHSDSQWKSGLFPILLQTCLELPGNESACEALLDLFIEKYDDVRHYVFQVWQSLASNTEDPSIKSVMAKNMLSLLSGIKPIEDKGKRLNILWCKDQDQPKHGGVQLSAHRKAAQQAWLTLLNLGLDKEQRKTVLRIMTARIVPWFTSVERLMDFLTDSYNLGGASSLLALSGLFYLMQEKNLDYPDFYRKLYSLLDNDLMNSKHRSRFFRLMNTFMSSTHLPAAMVASFIKRLSRLALYAPPAAIVAVVPWVYNMLKQHPTCTFMIHREVRSAAKLEELEEHGFVDPFNMGEVDPMVTGAIDSSLWELETLQSHYHPNVASLAKIISEQFTKREYSLEDFLDHSYATLLDAELGKETRKTPVVEFQIPKKVFTMDGEDSLLGDLMYEVLNEA